MTILLGSNNTTGYTAISRMAGLAGRSNFQPFVCGISGNVTTLAYYWGDTGLGVSEGLVLFLCNSTGTTLCHTSAITTPVSTTQFVTGAVSSTAVVAGQTYYIGLIADPANNGGDGRIGTSANGLGSDDDTSTVFTYPTPAANYTGISVNAGLPNWLGYADGTPSGGAQQQYLSLLGVGASLLPLAWIINRRNKLAWDEKSQILLPKGK